MEKEQRNGKNFLHRLQNVGKDLHFTLLSPNPVVDPIQSPYPFRLLSVTVDLSTNSTLLFTVVDTQNSRWSIQDSIVKDFLLGILWSRPCVNRFCPGHSFLQTSVRYMATSVLYNVKEFPRLCVSFLWTFWNCVANGLIKTVPREKHSLRDYYTKFLDHKGSCIEPFKTRSRWPMRTLVTRI